MEILYDVSFFLEKTYKVVKLKDTCVTNKCFLTLLSFILLNLQINNFKNHYYIYFLYMLFYIYLAYYY